ncbi:MAG: alkaline phosphatase family protein, partial [Armatimonadetes bacterium]|nr:alkaline phosphatase family protein [Anaerolineae bacterium]
MTDLITAADTLEAQIRANRPLPQLDSDFVIPHYAGLSIYNVAQTVAALLGAPAPHPLDPAVWGGHSPVGSIDRVLLFITDGLGYHLLRRIAAEDAPIADLIAQITGGRDFTPLTSVAPSTTACAMPTFWTAQPPSATGMLGTAMWLREFSTLGDMLRYSPVYGKGDPMEFEAWGIAPEAFIPVPSLPQQLNAVGVPTHLVLAGYLFGSGLSRYMHRGVQQHYPHTGQSDAYPRLRDALRETSGQRCYVAAYLPNIDSLAHAYGYDTPILR